MEHRQQLHTEYLHLLSELGNTFSQSHSDDPDVRRIIESIAFFSAHTKHVANETMRQSAHTLLRGPFDSFLAPEPSKAIVQAIPNGRLTEPTELPTETTLRFCASDKNAARFATTRPLSIFPMALVEGGMRPSTGGSFRLSLTFKSRHPNTTLPDILSLYVRHLGDRKSSARVMCLLKRHLQNASVFFDKPADTWKRGQPATVAFGKPAQPVNIPPGHKNPLEEIRSQVRFPEQNHFVHIKISPPEKPWKTFTLCIDLDDKWPSDLLLHRDTFYLHAVPVENKIQAFATPFVHDGTREKYDFLGGDDDRAQMHSVQGVFVDNAETPTIATPLLPSHLSQTPQYFDLEYSTGTEVTPKAPRFIPNLPDAFVHPRLITADLHWYHPHFASSAHLEQTVKLHTRHLNGVKWQAVGHVQSHHSGDLAQNPATALRLMALRTRQRLSLADVVHLMHSLGADETSIYANASDWIAEFHHVSATHAQTSGQEECIHYELRIAPHEEQWEGVIEEFIDALEQLLRAWSNHPLEFVVHRPIRRRPLARALAGELWA